MLAVGFLAVMIVSDKLDIKPERVKDEIYQDYQDGFAWTVDKDRDIVLFSCFDRGYKKRGRWCFTLKCGEIQTKTITSDDPLMISSMRRDSVLKKRLMKFGYSKTEADDKLEEISSDKRYAECVAKVTSAPKKEVKIELSGEAIKKRCLEEIKKKYEEEVYNNAFDLLKHPHLLQIIRHVLDYKIAGEKRKKLFVTLSCLRKDQKDSIFCIGIGKPGEGKSWLVENVLSLFPDGVVVRMNDATIASVYRASEDDVHYFDGKIVHFGDLSEKPSEELTELFNIFKQLVSEGIVTKWIMLKEDGEMVRRKLELRGKPVVTYTTISPETEETIRSRGMEWSPTLSPEQKEIVHQYQRITKRLPEDIYYPQYVRDLEVVIKCAFEILALQKEQILNPYTDVLDKAIAVETKDIKRARLKIYNIIEDVTHLYRFQRAKILIGRKEYVITHPTDVVYGAHIAADEIKFMLGGVPPALFDVLEAIKRAFKPLSREYNELVRLAHTKSEDKKAEQAEAIKELEEKAFRSSDVKKLTGDSKRSAQEYLRILADEKYIIKDSSKTPHKHWVPPTNGLIKQGECAWDVRALLESLFSENKFSEWSDSLRRNIPQRESGVYRESMENHLNELQKEVESLRIEDIYTPEYTPEEIFTYTLCTPSWELACAPHFEASPTFSPLKETYNNARGKSAPSRKSDENNLCGKCGTLLDSDKEWIGMGLGYLCPRCYEEPVQDVQKAREPPKPFINRLERDVKNCVVVLERKRGRKLTIQRDADDVVADFWNTYPEYEGHKTREDVLTAVLECIRKRSKTEKPPKKKNKKSSTSSTNKVSKDAVNFFSTLNEIKRVQNFKPDNNHAEPELDEDALITKFLKAYPENTEVQSENEHRFIALMHKAIKEAKGAQP